MIGADLRELLAAPRDAVPSGVHPSWLPMIPAAPDAAVAVWLARSACAELPALPPVRSGPPRDASHLVALVDPLPFLVETGRDQLAFATGLFDGVLAGARRITGDRRAAIARCAGVSLDELGMIRVGARAIAGHLSALQRRQLAMRLTRQIGLVVERELAGSWGAPVAFTRDP